MISNAELSVLFSFRDNVFLYSASQPGTQFVDHSSIELSLPLPLQVLGLKSYITITCPAPQLPVLSSYAINLYLSNLSK